MDSLKKILKNEKLNRFLTPFKKHLAKTEIGDQSVVVAYYLLLSIFPLLIAVGNILPFINVTPQNVLPYVKEVLPGQIYSFLGPAIKNLLTSNSGGMLSISLLAAIWSASKGVNAIQKALDRAYGVESSNSMLGRVASAGMVGALMLGIIAVAIVFSVGQVVLEFLQPIFNFSPKIVTVFLTLRWPIIILAFLAILSAMYKALPNAKIKWRSTLPGTLFATIGWMVLAQGFGFYARTFAKSVSGYQIIGSFIVLMFWLNFTAMILIFGGVLNVTIEEYRTGKQFEAKESRFDAFVKKKLAQRKAKKQSKELD